MVVAENDRNAVVVIREFNPKTDRERVEQVERSCEVGPSGEYSLHADLLGDPVCRVRNSPAYLMLVAEMVVIADGEETRDIVGMIRGCIKTVTCGRKLSRKTNHPPEPRPVFTKLAYILGLRVSPTHRRMKIGLKLVCRMEDWFRDKGAEYSYIATDATNKPSVNLFTGKCGYSKFRNPSVLVHPVFAHRLHINQQVTIIKLSCTDAEVIYRHTFSTTEFFPRDIDSVLKNNLNLGTFLAIPKDCTHAVSWVGSEWFLSYPPDSWAIMSVWNCNDVFKLEVKGASWLKKGFVKTTRVLDQVFPFLNLPSLPQIFNPFGLHLLYGLGGVGPAYLKLARALFGYAHNLAKKRKCGVVATEVSSEDPLKSAIPHWKVLSFNDLWCIKRLDEDYSEGYIGDWRKSQPDISFFLDPREF
ncbi:putative transcription regulator GNAT family [Helianthus annuus]|uniref:Putative acyl-CoA N-acyltransferase n=1 Tax=Helianthus annuus TaxID=4232 RepID=A0A251SJ94_HELAN|nr:probable N-acetyltransferase HLS1 [Helianthus annuus]KAF5769637.1 putative transcription regulator GNAT family [Helianthus annuus]KAJ0464615.1 putative transcription regulator GNAT family [Helianthus annuus]KAJ0486213.1 putative transcription regulator GNAT family [Helianthus annuus]KAJ0656764.1 putative transcription regulator GNAT family [Helianthus annuus]KAJ0660361.1 putative transcription regulator GNAT family [Helianthus annuus]